MQQPFAQPDLSADPFGSNTWSELLGCAAPKTLRRLTALRKPLMHGLLRAVGLAFVLALASARREPAGVAVSSPVYISPKAPVYPPRWSISADFKFYNSTNGELGPQGVMYQLVDSVSMRFRADDIYFAGSFVSTYDAIFITNTTDNYARLTNGSMACVDYPQSPLGLTQHWIADYCKFNSTVYHGATQAYRWYCKADLVTWLLDTSVPEGLLIYQFTYPQPLFDVYQHLWYNNFQILQSIDQTLFFPPAGWNCPR